MGTNAKSTPRESPLVPKSTACGTMPTTCLPDTLHHHNRHPQGRPRRPLQSPLRGLLRHLSLLQHQHPVALLQVPPTTQDLSPLPPLQHLSRPPVAHRCLPLLRSPLLNPLINHHIPLLAPLP